MDPLLGSDCACGKGKRIVQCRDCLSSYGSVCPACFVRNHRHISFHWAEVWRETLICFVWHDISALGINEGGTVEHRGMANNEEDINFIGSDGK